MAEDEMSLTEDGALALQEAQRFCGRANVAIVAAEHVLAGALLVLGTARYPAIPSREALEGALMLAQGGSDEPLETQVMFGSAAREAINATAYAVRQAGGRRIDARLLAAGIIESGEVSPMFFSALGTSKGELLDALMPAEG
ncbi:MAG: hypothetical protein IT303_15030 [Dehalococcoidia bacterium]|nr:hypothetical protein [Dehalococcoidia bacterium]